MSSLATGMTPQPLVLRLHLFPRWSFWLARRVLLVVPGRGFRSFGCCGRLNQTCGPDCTGRPSLAVEARYLVKQLSGHYHSRSPLSTANCNTSKSIGNNKWSRALLSTRDTVTFGAGEALCLNYLTRRTYSPWLRLLLWR